MPSLSSPGLFNPDFPLDSPREVLVPALIESLDEAERREADVQLYPIGFLRVPFTSDRLKPGHYFHIWRDEFPVRQPFYPTHTHANDVHSRVVYGQVVNRILDVVQDARGTYKLMETHYTADGSHQSPMEGNVSHRLKCEEIVDQDEIYAVLLGEFHESITRGEVVTLMKKSNFQPNAKLYNLVPNEKPEGEYPFDHRQYSAED